MSTKQKIIIVVLLLLVAILGISAFKKAGNKTEDKNSGNPQQNNSNSDQTDNLDPSTISFEDLLAQDPGPQGTPEEINEFASKVAAVAKQADVLNVTNCKPNPQVMSVRQGQEFRIKNDGTGEHKIYHTQGINLTIPPKSNNTYKPVFKSPGMYGYLCDEKMAGMFYVVAD
ncbi:MAG TPA: hypothetical protein VD998_01765 [Verrucomicrobiae bacterium]|nr:hypothetical protein [Verrucomicrobiae bacterium]